MDKRICIVSSKRSRNVEKIQKIVGECVWYVGYGEKQSYEDAGALNVIESGKLMQSRNAALDDSFKEGKICIQVSDDLGKIYIVPRDGKRFKHSDTREISFSESCEYIIKSLDETNLKLAGVSPTDNPYFYCGTEFKTTKFIVGDFIVVKPCDLRFDENLRLKEDYDYTLQHIKKYGGALRCERILPLFAHRENAGGAVDYRNEEREQEAIKYLLEKWGEVLVKNTKKGRPNEILFSRKNDVWQRFLASCQNSESQA